jgi:hypothetical protein
MIDETQEQWVAGQDGIEPTDQLVASYIETCTMAYELAVSIMKLGSATPHPTLGRC